jgi:hypothetical protein
MATRLEILQGALAQLATITLANDFSSDIGLNTVYWDVYDQDYNGPATVTIRDAEEDTDKVNQYRQTLHLEVEAIRYSTQANKLADGLALLADLKQVLITDSWAGPGVIVRPTGNSKDIEGKGKQAIRVTLMIDVEYREDA